jgi:hypothetical protein
LAWRKNLLGAGWKLGYGSWVGWRCAGSNAGGIRAGRAAARWAPGRLCPDRPRGAHLCCSSCAAEGRRAGSFCRHSATTSRIARLKWRWPHCASSCGGGPCGGPGRRGAGGRRGRREQLRRALTRPDVYQARQPSRLQTLSRPPPHTHTHTHLQRHQQHLHGGILGERRVAVGHLQQRDAKRPDVGRRAVPLGVSGVGRLGVGIWGENNGRGEGRTANGARGHDRWTRRVARAAAGPAPQPRRPLPAPGAHSVCSSTSGAIQHGVPTNVFRLTRPLPPHSPPRSIVALTPKSPRATWPSLSTRMLPACGG